MRIKDCYIENFGVFHRRSFRFDAGLNIFKEENGWGKSTLAAFVKAMFYGLEYRQRSKDLYDRTRYLPWQGGSCGGYLIFTTVKAPFGDGGSQQEKEYRIERYFGKKSTDDTFALYDCASGLPSSDFSEKVGEELFGIDCDSFERSLFISPDGKPPAMQDSINAKLGNLIDNTDDVNNFESACDTLDKLATSIKAKRGSGGKLSAAEQRMTEIRENLEKCRGALQQAERVQQTIDDVRGKRKELEEQRDLIRSELSALDIQGKKREYRRLLDRRRELEEQLRQLSDIFRGSPPSQEEISFNAVRAADIRAEKLSLENRPVTEEDLTQFAELKKLFNPQPPSQEELDRCGRALQEYAGLTAQLKSGGPSPEEWTEYLGLSAELGDFPPSSEEIDDCMDACEEALRLREEIARLEAKPTRLSGEITQEALHEKGGRELAKVMPAKTGAGRSTLPHLMSGSSVLPHLTSGLLLLVLGSLLLAFGILLLVIDSASLAFPASSFLIPAGVAGGLLLLVLGLLRVARRKSFLRQAARAQDITDRLEQELSAKKEQYSRLENRVLSSVHSFLRNGKEAMVSGAGGEAESGTDAFPLAGVPRFLSDIRLKAERYSLLSRRIRETEKRNSALEQEASRCLDAAFVLLEPFREKCPGLEGEALLALLADRRRRYEDLDRRISDDRRTRDTIAALQNALELFLEGCQLPEMMDYDEKMELVRDSFRDYTRLRQELSGLNRQINEFVTEHHLNEDILSSLPASPESGKSMEDLQRELNGNDGEMQRIIRQISDYEKELDALSLQTDKIQQLESEYEELERQKRFLKERYRLLTKTKDLLLEAKERLTTGYLREMQESFRQYLSDIAPDAPLIRLDAGLGAGVEGSGKLWKDAYLSNGYRDLVNVCTRLALADAMYKGEIPFLILDDPFSNLDDSKMGAALAFLRRLGDRTQVFYFICHDSRAPERDLDRRLAERDSLLDVTRAHGAGDLGRRLAERDSLL